MSNKSIEEQKREAVAKYVRQANDCLTYGMPAIRYWGAVEADAYEADLKKYLVIFTELKADGKTIKEAVTNVGDIAYSMMHIWNEGLCGIRGWKVYPECLATASSKVVEKQEKPEKLSVEIHNAPWIMREKEQEEKKSKDKDAKEESNESKEVNESKDEPKDI